MIVGENLGALHEPQPKRRKVRKGTQSCWECRRRKVRCIFAASADNVCQNCDRRGTSCINQELPDKPKRLSLTDNNVIQGRLERVEELLGRLADRTVDADIPELPTRNPLLATGKKSTLERFSPPVIKPTCPVPSGRAADKYEDVCRNLLAVWPSQRDVDRICTLPVGISVQLHVGICAPYSSSANRELPSPREMLKLPPPGSHPVLIARKLLLLGTYLQGILPTSIRKLPDLGISYRNLMSLVVDTAVRLVNTNEDLTSSVEGIECIILETLYQNYAGNLYRAWLAVRRAVTMVQMMGLDRGRNSASLKFLEPEGRASFNADEICFRLVEIDSYLSLMLGLPRSSLQTRLATPKALDGCEPIDRLQRIHCAVADRLLQRNESNLAETHEIDMLLHKAAGEMPSQWWLTPDFSAEIDTSSSTRVLHSTGRLMIQFTHYHFLIRLHLPYMLRSAPDKRYYHSKITAVHASRETLARYIAFRTSNPAHFYCRGADFLAFIATIVLCLAHIDPRCGRRHGCASDVVENESENISGTATAAVLDFLTLSRYSDRGMMERVLSMMDGMVSGGGNHDHEDDVIASKIVRILRPLLEIEANAASGNISYSTRSFRQCDGGSMVSNEDPAFDGKLVNEGKELHVHIPFFGTINFERHPIQTSFAVSREAPIRGSFKETTVGAKGAAHPEGLFLASDGQFPCSIEDNELNSEDQLVSMLPGAPSSCLGVSHVGVANNHSNNTQQDHPTVFTGFAGALGEDFDDYWDLEKVNLAFFESLFSVTTAASVDMVETESWNHWAGR
ncbi:hypothetical protein BX600DRAFT_444895 [Xylariales sp. PMI_506]|nr:hypothetical protein BX600DRAFT_444895 [Xylariales sp. PMI_506]